MEEIISYRGKCTKCGRVQLYHDKSKVDVECYDCKRKAKASELYASMSDQLEGATIEKLSMDESCGHFNIVGMVVKCKDGTYRTMWAFDSDGNEAFIEVNEMYEEGLSEWE